MSGKARGAAAAAPRATPLTIVSGAVAGDDVQSVAASASAGLGCPVAIALPSRGAPVLWPPSAAEPGVIRELSEHAATVIAGLEAADPPSVSDSVPIRIGHGVVGIVAALGRDQAHPERRAWLEAAAAAAAVTALIRETQDGDLEVARRALLQALALAPPSDAGALVSEAQRLGCDLVAGAAAICAEWTGDAARELPDGSAALLAEVTENHVLALVPVAPKGSGHDLRLLCSELERRGMRVATSVPRRNPAALHDAIREAEVMLGLATEPDAMLSTQEEIYRLLIGVLLRDPAELEILRASTISGLEKYDAEHDTDLLATLRAFLAHHGATTETAEAMQLHRHTVGYRLTRVLEVSGLSPYESDGRERLSLGLKAHRILEADRRRALPPQTGS
ncbi:MAG: helix-turn-helix domain-containing protein [Actinomycetota bacterium]|nr:helix-turn-helix domain-containing protein [Actinomycetota bacterium]